MTQLKSIQILSMWDKINELSRQNLSQAQIAEALGCCRDTVRRYQHMSEAEFKELLVKTTRRHTCKLDAYYNFIADQLKDVPSLSAPQILDHLKEHFPNLPYVSDRTVYNMVQKVRAQEEIPKMSMNIRQMTQVPECEYGSQAQVDYGETWLRTTKGRRIKVYFFVMVLKRSRYKFFYLQNVPFTAKTTVYAHHLAFQYFGGMPKEVVYDQDKKMLTRENYGDYIMTGDFAQYTIDAGYKVTFLHAADPQSKGCVENVVRYIKGNFLSGRTYLNIESLNEEALGWLARTGNQKKHSMTHLVPSEVFKEEQKYLTPYHLKLDKPEQVAREYNVRKDNTVMYCSNTYSLPIGTYKGPGTKVLVIRNVDTNELEIYEPEDFSLITRHSICPLKGKYISKEGHMANKSRDMIEDEKILREYLETWDDESILSQFLIRLKKDRPRYYKSTL